MGALYLRLPARNRPRRFTAAPNADTWAAIMRDFFPVARKIYYYAAGHS